MTEVDYLKEASFVDVSKIVLGNWTDEDHEEFFNATKIEDEDCLRRRTGRLIMFGSFCAMCLVAFIWWTYKSRWERKERISRFRVKEGVLQGYATPGKMKIGMG